MTLFTNPNFIDHIVRSQNAERAIDQSHYSLLQSFIEIETRSVLELAFRYMVNSRRDSILDEDVLAAARDLHHITLPVSLPANPAKPQEDTLLTTRQLFDRETELLSAFQSHPRLQAKWVYIKGRVPTIAENVSIKCLAQLSEQSNEDTGHRGQLFSVIKDDPYSLLSKEQLEYFRMVRDHILEDPWPKKTMPADGDLNGMMPFFLKMLGEGRINESGMAFLLRLLENKWVWAGIEYSLRKVLNILLTYQGIQAFEVGAKIAQLVERFCDKYPILRDIYVSHQDDSYAGVLKKIPFELYLGIPVVLSPAWLAKCRKDSEHSHLMAKLCMRALLIYSGQLRLFKEYLHRNLNTCIYWQPCPELAEDPYLRMF